MKAHVYYALRRAVQSLADSTKVTYVYRGLACRLSGRNSPYVSHREVQYATEDAYVDGGEGNGVLIYNDKYAVCIEGSAVPAARQIPGWAVKGYDGTYIAEDDVAGEWLPAVVPADMVRGLLAGAAKWLVDVPQLQSPLATVWVLLPLVIDWRDDGRPVYQFVQPPADESESESA